MYNGDLAANLKYIVEGGQIRIWQQATVGIFDCYTGEV
jgi:hypothetical protein